MKVQIRQSVFETNSSTTHVLSLFNKENWEKFKNSDDQLFMDWWDTREFVSREDLQKKYEEQCRKKGTTPSDDDSEDFQEWLQEEGFYNYEDLLEKIEILAEEVPDSQYVAVSFFGYEW